MSLKLTSTAQIVQYVNILCYGESGTGKTMLCNTAHKPLILSAEGGLLSLAEFDLPVFEIDGRNQLNDAYDWLKSSKEAKDKYDTICIDSISEIAEILLAEEKASTKDIRQAYGTMAELMTITIRAYRNLPFHTYFTAKVKKVVDEQTGATSFMPSVPGQLLLNNLPYLFDEVLRLEIGKMPTTKEKYRYLDTIGDRRYIAKDRSGRLAPQEEPNLKNLIHKITNVGEAVTKSVTQLKKEA